MTFIKKYFKVILCFMAFALVSLAFAFAPTYTALAASQTITAEYKLAITGVKIKNVDLSSDKAEDKDLKIPLVDISGFGAEAKLTVRVYDPSLNSHDYSLADKNADYFKENTDNSISVKTLSSGTYQVMYIVKVGTKVYASTPYQVTVSNARYKFVEEIVDKTGAKILLPSTMAQNNEKAYKLPIAKVKNIADKEGKTLLDPNMIKLSKDNGNTVIELKVGDSATDYAKTFYKYDGEYYFVPATTGEYKLTYSYTMGDNQPQETIAFEVDSAADYVAPTTEELKVTKPTISNIVLGNTGIELPDVVMSAKGESAIEHNTVIEVKCGDYSQKLINTFTIDMTLDKFTNGAGANPTNWKDLKGDYTFTYTATDAYGREKSTTVTVKDVKNNKTPNITMSYNYDLNADGSLKGEVKTDKEVQFNTTMGYDEIVIPAVYATDAISKFEDFTFVRYIQRTSNSKNYYVDNVRRDGSNLVALKITENDDGTFSFEDGWNFALVSNDVEFVKESTTLDSTYNNKYIIEVKDNTFKFKGIYDSSKAEAERFDTTSDSAKLWKEKLGQRDLTKADTKITTNMEQSFKFSYDSQIVNDGDFSGEYTIYYYSILKNDAKSSTDNKTYTITIDKNANYTREIKETPIVSFDTSVFIPNEMNSDDELNVKVVTNDSTDSNLKTVLFYTYVRPETLDKTVRDAVEGIKTHGYSHAFDNAEFREALRLSDKFNFVDEIAEKEYKFTLKDVGVNKNVYVVAMAMNNDGLIGYTSIKTINIKTTTNDNNVPTVEKITLGNEELDSVLYNSGAIKTDYVVTKDGETILLPTVKFKDTEDDYLSLSAKYYVMTEGKEDVNPDDYEGIILDDSITDVNTIGGSITPVQNVEGKYYVVYTAIDDAGNAQVMYFTFDVADRSYPVLYINASGNGVSQAGNTATVKADVEVSFEGIVKTSKHKDVTSEIAESDKSLRVISNGLDFEQTGKNTFKFKKVGMYEVEFTATYNGKKTTKKLYINVDSLQDAVWENTVDRIGEKPKSGKDYGYFDVSTTEAVKLPTLTASRGDKVLAVAVKVTRQGTEVELDNNTFMPKEKGTYTVTYTAYESIADREEGKNPVLTKPYTVKVGDDENPVVSISNKTKLEQNIVLEGNEIDYKLNISSDGKIEVVIENNGKTTKIDTGFTMSDIDSKGNENALDRSDISVTFSSDADYSTEESSSSFKHYKLEETGKYTVKITVNDGRGNSSEASYSFNVISKATAGKVNKDNKLGIILIVVSSVLLVGIVAFFLIASRKGKGKKKKSVKTTVESSKVENKEETKVDDTKSSDVE